MRHKSFNKSEGENYSQDNLCLERTRSNTPTRFWVVKASTFSAILGKPRSTLQMWNFDPITSESRHWSNEELQGREVHAKDLSEKAAKKIHEAGNCEFHKTKIQATHC